MQKEIQSGIQIAIGQLYAEKNCEKVIVVERLEGGQVYFGCLYGFDETRVSSGYGSEMEERFLERYTLLEKPLSELLKIGEAIIRGEIDFRVENPAVDFQDENAIVSADAKSGLLSRVSALEKASMQMESLKQCFSLAMAKKKAELEIIRRERRKTDFSAPGTC